ncbi:MAG: formylglycine-generating enzyme family protein [Micropepsaceae bacterium]
MRWLFGLFVLIFSVPISTSRTQAAETFRDCPDCPLMVTVPAGSFAMGASPDEISKSVSEGAVLKYIEDEKPQHVVEVKQFSISVTEVTRDQFEAFVRDTARKVEGPCWHYKMSENTFVSFSSNDWRNPGFVQEGTHPVVCVNWNDATAYVHWLSQRSAKQYRLLTEAEWEYAAQAGAATRQYWGTDYASACRYANINDRSRAAADHLEIRPIWLFPCTDGFINTAPVAHYEPNAFGVYDMLGNVEELVEDCYVSNYDGAPTDGSARVTVDCSHHVVRGGSWFGSPWAINSAIRWRQSASFRASNQGFRVARTE